MGAAIADSWPKMKSCDLFQEVLLLFHWNPQDFPRPCGTLDETWIHYWTPEITEQYKQWVTVCAKVITVPSAGKIITTVFGAYMLCYRTTGK